MSLRDNAHYNNAFLIISACFNQNLPAPRNMVTMPTSIRDLLRAEMETNRANFHALLTTLNEADLARPSANSAFSNREILHHMVLSLEGVPWEVRAAQRGRNFFVVPQSFYDVVIVPATRLTAWFQSKVSLARNYDAAHAHALQVLEKVQDSEWVYPLQMLYVKTTLEGVFRLQARHIAEHTAQVI